MPSCLAVFFCTNTSQYVWHDNTGTPHVIHQAEGGEQGDPLMPALYCLGPHSALSQAHSQLQAEEHVYAFLDDIYAVVPSARVRPVLNLLSHHPSTGAHVQLHQGKTRLWNAAGVQPPNTSSFHQAWVGD